ncbi:MAG: glycine cleavage system protein GcvH [Candidatus Latescibacterota bacterium]|nr:MAG: glycine cleavage system protein GcvH [Candidatus Latescibacterota bacterium]
MDFDTMRFSKEHEWVKVDNGSDVVTVGITDYASGELGDIVYIEFPETGQEVKISEPMGTIEAVKTVADLFSPVTGTVKEVNGAVNDDPGIVNQSPYGEGWFVKIEMSDKSELEGLMGKAEYDRMVGKE